MVLRKYYAIVLSHTFTSNALPVRQYAEQAQQAGDALPSWYDETVIVVDVSFVVLNSRNDFTAFNCCL